MLLIFVALSRFAPFLLLTVLQVTALLSEIAMVFSMRLLVFMKVLRLLSFPAVLMTIVEPLAFVEPWRLVVPSTLGGLLTLAFFVKASEVPLAFLALRSWVASLLLAVLKMAALLSVILLVFLMLPLVFVSLLGLLSIPAVLLRIVELLALVRPMQLAVLPSFVELLAFVGSRAYVMQVLRSVLALVRMESSVPAPSESVDHRLVAFPGGGVVTACQGVGVSDVLTAPPLRKMARGEGSEDDGDGSELPDDVHAPAFPIRAMSSAGPFDFVRGRMPPGTREEDNAINQFPHQPCTADTAMASFGSLASGFEGKLDTLTLHICKPLRLPKFA
ncbi:unnamed protein product [Prorocentrum cordatum]|uniref:Uncharacterized protein n=1 Tax=Prorocentrum cordatum TaxID=2364126 RepID=A0ABN9S729_9DINO|nr:unnamed protein product [Polarella glacialis]